MVLPYVSERAESTDASDRAESDTRDELRTVAFRLREIQRLLGARVRQENRRLEAEGLEPVTDHGFFHPEGEDEPQR